MAITKRDVEEWRTHPVTLVWFNGVRQKIRDLEEWFSDGNTYNADSVNSTALATANILGQIRGLKDVLEISEDTVIKGA